MEIKFVDYNSPLYSESLNLRDRVLRIPNGMSIYNDNLEGDQTDHHMVLIENEQIVGCLVLSILDSSTLKMRQVAVEESKRGIGIGASLVASAEKFAIENDYGKIVLNARKVVLGFYERLGYQSLGPEFIEVGIPHQKMEKQLFQ